ncbi:putative topoisomerase IB [Beutenbergia cavernae DSM 12333]|uniref:DNA topoisomerase n=1 Tax=Beutenbergia cavernae (strain ATCC BAA-8 / DSM 12333 / CCUG 43141 / JCM 11478 / NBRC 16432 / NCIMB 13614 / HKI 0122) TaxID=471853 RepID=C5C3Y8_BEUC1|nr:DNA topoisomerase IB [Beutenbergia cavernae]ACQ79901.1 putative topoisomerase IB [Beutenbergia cavernae DSM 12333]
MRLRRSNVQGRGFRRARAGRGFTYTDPRGARVTDQATRARIEELAIPPAWQDVWISPHENGHIQATGVDAAGRTQYLYHAAWRAKRDRVKFDRALELAATLPAARRGVTRDLSAPEPTAARALAVAFRLLDTAYLRIGSERYASRHGSRGLATLLVRHVAVDGDVVELEFPGKSGVLWSARLEDARLARVVEEMRDRPARQRFLAWSERGSWTPLTPVEINDDVRARTGEEFSSKDFRTLHGTVIAARALADAGPARTRRQRQERVVEAVRHTAATLGNTPAVARASYIDPRVVDRYQAGEVIVVPSGGSAEAALRRLVLGDDAES